MSTHPWRMALCLGVAALAACADSLAAPPLPTDPSLAPATPLLEETPTEENDGWMAGLVFVRTEATAWFSGFGQAYGAGRTDFWGNTATQRLELRVLRDNAVIATSPVQAKSFGQLSPVRGWVKDTVGLPTQATCGLQAVAFADGTAEFRVLGQNLSAWVGLGTQIDNASAMAWLPDCLPPTPGNGYEEDCEFCQQWFQYEDGMIVDEWWDCSPISSNVCSERMS